jgi:hypothetical protein
MTGCCTRVVYDFVAGWWCPEHGDQNDDFVADPHYDAAAAWAAGDDEARPFGEAWMAAAESGSAGDAGASVQTREERYAEAKAENDFAAD